jgi:hypothetical protein
MHQRVSALMHPGLNTGHHRSAIAPGHADRTGFTINQHDMTREFLQGR